MALFNHTIVNKNRKANQCEQLLYALVATLVFEGIIRKFLPPLKTPVFFLKDVLCIIGLIRINSMKLPYDMVKFRGIWLTVFILFIPLLILTASKDIILSIFAAKQYLLYVITAILAVAAFPPHKVENFRKFLFFCAIMLVPTTMVAILQNSLPGSHWLNRSVGGDSLEAFSAAGHLRVGSTFSFTAQYSWFLIAESFIVVTSFFLPPQFNNQLIRIIMPFAHLVLLVMLVVSSFITGGRTAVLGTGVTLALGAVLIGIKRPAWFIATALPIFFAGLSLLVVLRAAKPEFFATYDARSKGTKDVSHNEEIEGRIVGGFTDWTTWFWDQNSLSIFLGNGLGIMSNGSGQVSDYAGQMKDSFGWTEGDVPTTFWEGGFYLGIVWYWFRLSMVLLCYRLWRSIKDAKLASAASVPLAYVIIQGISSNMGMQPPVAIWLWLGVGVVFFIYRYEKSLVKDSATNTALLT